MRPKKLSAEDQRRVDEFIHSGYNDVERKPFRPLLLLLFLFIVLLGLSGISYLIAYLNQAI